MPWLTDPDQKVRSFAQQYIASLDRRIAAEQRRSEEDLEMRKRRYDDLPRGRKIASCFVRLKRYYWLPFLLPRAGYFGIGAHRAQLLLIAVDLLQDDLVGSGFDC